MSLSVFNFKQVRDTEAIYKVLLQFDCIFPHLKDKVSDYFDFSEKLKQNAEFYIALADGVVCGLVVFYANNLQSRVGYITLIGLLPEWQGRNIGYHLVEHCSNAARDKGMKLLRLEVDLDNVHAIRFYEKNGFTCCSKATESSMYMEKTLV